MKLLLVVLVLSNITFADEPPVKENVVVKYKQYEKFDLGDLEIKGSIIAPGDLSIRERQRNIFKRDLFSRDNFNEEVIQDLRNLR